jgi:hypothetical protein
MDPPPLEDLLPPREHPRSGFDGVMSKMDIKGVGEPERGEKRDINRRTDGQDKVQPT